MNFVFRCTHLSLGSSCMMSVSRHITADGSSLSCSRLEVVRFITAPRTSRRTCKLGLCAITPPVTPSELLPGAPPPLVSEIPLAVPSFVLCLLNGPLEDWESIASRIMLLPVIAECPPSAAAPALVTRVDGVVSLPPSPRLEASTTPLSCAFSKPGLFWSSFAA